MPGGLFGIDTLAYRCCALLRVYASTHVACTQAIEGANILAEGNPVRIGALLA